MHLVNVAFHAANALLLFLVLRRLTGALWRSAIVAALFALHPLRVESVAWISERKDVLSGFFFLLTIWAYARYAEGRRQKSRMQNAECQKPEVQQSEVRGPVSVVTDHWIADRAIYLLALLFFALGLMSKPMLVTLPFVLLLLDFWPLRRFQPAPSRLKPSARKFHPSAFILQPLLLEKAPLLRPRRHLLRHHLPGPGAGRGHGAAWPSFSLEDRVANAMVSYVRYLGKMFWPADLAAIYPHPACRYLSFGPMARLANLAPPPCCCWPFRRSASASFAAGPSSPSAGSGSSA